MHTEKLFKKRMVSETFGFFLLGLGLFIGTSLLCHSLAVNNLGPESIGDLVGPLGKKIAIPMLKTLGIVSFAYPLAMVVFGLSLVMGLSLQVKPKHLIALLGLTVFLSGLVQVVSPLPQTFDLENGVGGIIGTKLGNVLTKNIGIAGALITLGFCLVVTMVSTGKFIISKTAEVVEYFSYFIKRLFMQSLATPAVGSSMTVSKGIAKPDQTNANSRNHKEGDTTTDLYMDLRSSPLANPKPDSSLFSFTELVKKNGNNSDEISNRLTEELRQFKVDGQVQKVTDGPVVTTYEFEPAAGTRVSKIVGLGEDLARLLKANSLRVIAPIPGKDTVGFEIPNDKRRSIGFGNLIDKLSTYSKNMALPICMGVDTFGNPVFEDLADMPHLLVAGSTGSGKSVFLNALIASLVCKRTAKELRFVMVDPKMVELASYGKLPHMACEVVTDLNNHGLPVLNRLVEEMEERYQLLKTLGAKNLPAFNKIIKSSRKTKFPNFPGKWQPLPYIVVVIEEFADFILVLGKEAETAITRLAQKARAAGIHLVIATQRPSADVVTGLIKANFPTRVSFRVLSQVDSRTILDQGGAESLLGKGDMLYLSPTGLQRIHGAILGDDEISKMIKSCKIG